MDQQPILQSITKYEKDMGVTIGEIAEAIGAFPSDVEEVVKDLHSKDLVKCYIYKGELYVVFQTKRSSHRTEDMEHEIMYR